MTRPPPLLWKCLGLAAAFHGLAWLSLHLCGTPDPFAPYWLPNGLAWALLMRSPRKEHPALLAAVYFSNVAANGGAGMPAAQAFAFAAANTAEILLASFFMGCLHAPSPCMGRKREVFSLLPAAAGAAALGGLVGGAAAGYFSGRPPLPQAVAWGTADALGLLLTAPLWLAWTESSQACRRMTPLRRGEGIAALTTLVWASLFAFHRAPGDDTRTYLIIPPLLWAILRFGPRGGTAATLLASTIASVLTARGMGPFAGPAPYAMASLQAFLLVLALSSLFLSATVEEMETTSEKLAENKAKLNAFLQEMPAVLWTVDRDMRFTFTQGALLKKMNISPEKLLGTTLQDYFGTHDPSFIAIRKHQEALAGTAVDYRQEWAERVFQTHLEPLRNAGGDIIGVIGVSQDVTLESRAEDARHQEHKMEALSRLASRVAHDFNNALTAILGYCELLQEDFDAADPRLKDLKTIEASALRAAQTAERLTAFSRHKMNEGRPLDLNALLQENDAALAEVLGPAVSRVYRLEPGLPLIHLDPAQMKDVLRHLALNARDAMPQGGQLTLATARRRNDDGHEILRLTVQDGGPGLSEEARTHLFEPYFSTKPREKGNGVGLALCYGLIRQNGGAITYHGGPGKGAAFFLDFPPAGARTAGPAAPLPDQEPTPRGTEIVLLAEDEEPVRRSLERIIRGWGYTVLTAPHGADALKILEADTVKKIRLLLSDVVMPEMDGVSLCKAATQKRPDVRRLLMSGHAEASLLEEGRLPPQTAFIQKPFTFPALARKLRTLLDDPASAPHS